MDKAIKKFFFFLTILLMGNNLRAATITFTVNAGAAGLTIPPYTYGSNDLITNNPTTVTTPTVILVHGIPLYRQGGNRLTAYNWENNASNAGTDYGPNHEDWYMVPNGVTPPGMPATTLTTFIAGNNALNAASLVTLQMAGYVSADGNCNCDVTETGAADTSGTYWKAVSFTGSALTGTTAPVTTDKVVYMNEEMSYLLATVGGANSGGAKFYDLDNEPALWNSTHPLVHPSQAACTEVAGKGISLSTVITAADSNAQVLGPVAYGWSEYVNNQGAPDDSPTLNAYSGNPNIIAYLDYYLATMKTASNTAGRRLLHYLDLHWYPEATGLDAGTAVRITNDDTTYGVAVARMQAPRSLWDPTYTETSWIAQDSTGGPITLIPRLQSAVSQYYPGTGLSFSEYQYGSGEDISGGVAQADALGVFGQYGAIACRWDDGTNNTYVAAAYNLYLNYNGAGASFGNLSIPATSSSVSLMSAYASRSAVSPNMIWVVVINRDFPSPGTAVTDTGSFSINNLAGGQSIASIRAYRFDPTHSSPTSVAAPSFTTNTFTDSSIPGRSGTLYEITLNQYTPTPSNTATSTPTATHSSTPTSSPTFTSSPTATNSPTPTSTSTVCTDGSGNTCTFTSTFTATNTFTTTATPTWTASPTVTSTFTSTPTFTSTATPTNSFTPTHTYTPTSSPTVTSTPTITFTPTITPTTFNGPPIGGLFIYPNPVYGSGPVSIQFALNGSAGQVNLKLFTTAFRKVRESSLQNTPAGLVQTQLNMVDDHGTPLANGLYYLVITAPQGHVVGKIINLQ